MALLMCDSFNFYSTSHATLGKWSSNSGTITASAGRWSTNNALGFSNAQSAVTRTLSPSGSTCIVGVAFKVNALNVDRQFLQLYSSGTSQWYAYVENTSGLIKIVRGSTVIATSSVAVAAATWNYLEIKTLLSTTVGTVDMQLNGISVASVSGVNTANAGNTTFTHVQIGCLFNLAGGHQHDFNDFVVMDGSGSLNNNFLGDVRIDPHFVTANGNSNDSTPSTGTNRAANVDDTTPNGDTDYNSLTAANQVDTMTLQDLIRTGSNILGMQVSIYAEKTDAGTATIAPVIRAGGTDYVGTTQALTTSYGYFNQVYDTNPATGARPTEAEFNAFELGYKRIA